MEELKAVEQALAPRVAEERGIVAAKPQAQAAQGDTLTPYDSRRFSGAGLLNVSERENAILSAPLQPHEIHIKDEGGRTTAYLSHDMARNRLFAAFGVGRWAMVPVSDPQAKVEHQRNRDGEPRDKVTVIQTWDLFVRGIYVGRATGDGTYFSDNPTTCERDAIESCQSVALRTICQKSLGMGLELFDKNQRERLMALARQGEQQGKRPTPAPPAPKPTVKQQAAAQGAPIAQAAKENREAKQAAPEPKVDANGLRRFHAVRNECGLDETAGKKILGEFGLTSSKDIPAAKLESIVRRMKVFAGLEPPDPA